MYWWSCGVSPKALRNRKMFRLRLVSSTKVSGQTIFKRSSLVTTLAAKGYLVFDGKMRSIKLLPAVPAADLARTVERLRAALARYMAAHDRLAQASGSSEVCDCDLCGPARLLRDAAAVECAPASAYAE